jgi:ankyrin repeat protein
MNGCIVDVERLIVYAPDTIEQGGGHVKSTPLQVSVRLENIGIATMLLKAGANPNSEDLEGLNSMARAMRTNNLEMILLLLDHQAYVPPATIRVVAYHNRSEMMRIFLENGLDVERKNMRGRTAMHIAALYGHRELFEVLVQWNSNVRATADNDATPLHYAAQKGHNELVEELIRLGASISAKTNGLGSSLQAKVSNGATPLHYAASGGAEYSLLYMLDKGGNIDATDHHGQTLLHYAAERGRTGIVRILIARGVDIEPTSTHGGPHDLTTPERLAVHFGMIESAGLIRAEIERRQQLAIAFATGGQKRLGENSRVYLVDELVLQIIMKRVCK